MAPVLSLWAGAFFMAVVCYYAPPAASKQGLSMPEFIAGLLSVAFAFLGGLTGVIALFEEAASSRNRQ
jgi:hypothetical protein